MSAVRGRFFSSTTKRRSSSGSAGRCGTRGTTSPKRAAPAMRSAISPSATSTSPSSTT
jgi:hypothetical protein